MQPEVFPDRQLEDDSPVGRQECQSPTSDAVYRDSDRRRARHLYRTANRGEDTADREKGCGLPGAVRPEECSPASTRRLRLRTTGSPP